MNLYTIVLSLIVALGGLLYGFDTAVISGTLNYIQPYFGLSEAGLGWTVSSLLFGSLAGVYLAGIIGQRWGRKPSMSAASLIFIVSALLSALSVNLWMFICARVLGGIAVGIVSTLAPVYIAEVAPARYRGMLVSFNQLAIVIGILIAFFTNYFLVNTGENNWRWMLSVMAFPSVLLFVALFFVPESPRWLIERGFRDKAAAVLAKSLPAEAISAEISDIESSFRNKEKVSYRELFGVGGRKVLLIGLMLCIFQQITGINTIMYYAPKIFSMNGYSGDVALLQTVIIGILNLVSTLAAILVVDKAGRKPLLLVGSLGMGISLLSLSVLYHLGLQGGTGVLIAILCYISFFSLSLGPVIWVVVSEIFPNRIRSLGMSVAMIGLYVANILVTTSFPVMLTALSGETTFFIFFVICICCFFYVMKYVPETKGKSLEELEEVLKK